MKRVSKDKVLILMIAAMFGCLSTYADTEEDLLLSVRALPTVSIEKLSESVENGWASPGTGVVSTDLRSVFTLQTTGTDDDYEFIITSEINTDGGTAQAFGKNESILFANTTKPPTNSDVIDAKDWGNNNKNVIVYPINVAVGSPMSVVHKLPHEKYGDCYAVRVNGSTGDL